MHRWLLNVFWYFQTHKNEQSLENKTQSSSNYILVGWKCSTISHWWKPGWQLTAGAITEPVSAHPHRAWHLTSWLAEGLSYKKQKKNGGHYVKKTAQNCASFFFFGKYFRKICWWDIEEKIIKVSWRDPGQNGRFWGPFLVLWNVSLPENVEKLTFRCHVRPNRLKICMYDRMLGAVTLETCRPPQFHPKLSKKLFLWKSRFFSFLVVFWPQNDVSIPKLAEAHKSLHIKVWESWSYPGVATIAIAFAIL